MTIKLPMANSHVPKRSLLDDSDPDLELDGGVNLQINQEYARRFEHNKKREELRRREVLSQLSINPPSSSENTSKPSYFGLS